MARLTIQCVLPRRPAESRGMTKTILFVICLIVIAVAVFFAAPALGGPFDGNDHPVADGGSIIVT
jgi:hypothetical protein